MAEEEAADGTAAQETRQGEAAADEEPKEEAAAAGDEGEEALDPAKSPSPAEDDEDPEQFSEEEVDPDAPDPDAAVDEEMEDEDEDEERETLKESAVAGSESLKRLLTRDEEDDDEPSSKRRKKSLQSAEEQKISQKLLTKWKLQGDIVVAHVLEQLPLEELKQLDSMGYRPGQFGNPWGKSEAELLARESATIREKSMQNSRKLDTVDLFRHKHKIDKEKDTALRELSHVSLRYVIDKYVASKHDLDDIIEESKLAKSVDNNKTQSSCADDPGCLTLGRFCRLELIDPVADAAIFGDANLTFALKLVRHRKACSHVGRVIATTFEELDTLKERYPEIEQSIATLEEHYAEVLHGVDCTRIGENPFFQSIEPRSLGAVYYNFPHSGAIQGFFDGHPVVNWRHENLMRLFFRALRAFVKPGGFAKVASNAGAVGVRYSYIVGGAEQNEFTHIETMPFTEWILHRYGRSYGDRRDAYKRPDAVNNQSYNAQKGESDMVYCFKFEPTGATLGPQFVRLPPTLKTIAACTDGPFTRLKGPAKKQKAMELHKRFVTEISGTHVG